MYTLYVVILLCSVFVGCVYNVHTCTGAQYICVGILSNYVCSVYIHCTVYTLHLVLASFSLHQPVLIIHKYVLSVLTYVFDTITFYLLGKLDCIVSVSTYIPQHSYLCDEPQFPL